MTPEMVACLAILAVAIGAFAWDRLPADVIALGVMLAVIATGLLPADKAFAGFSSDTVMMILGLLIMTVGLVQTGVVEITGRFVFEFAGRSQAVFLPIMMVSVAVLSAFMSNTAATAFFVPLVVGYAAKIGVSPARFLLPLAFASILTSSVTLISTSTNLIVSDLLGTYQQPPMGMFELAPVGLPIAVAGILYVWLIGVRLLPQRSNQKAEEKIGERTYQADILIPEESPLIGKSLKEAHLTEDAGMTVVKAIRGSDTLRRAALDELELAAGDELLIEGLRADLLKIKDIKGIDFKADVHPAKPPEKETEKKDKEKDEEEEDEKTIVEGVLLPRSPLIGRSLRSLAFKERYGLEVLAIHRAGSLPSSISSARLRMGDVLLLQGTPQNVKALEQGNLFNIFGSVQEERLNRGHAPLAAAIFALAINRRNDEAGVIARCHAGRRVPHAADALPVSGRRLSPGRVEGVDPHWRAAVVVGAAMEASAPVNTWRNSS
ncbi:MAG: SLC13 family permease [Rhodospirillales bacterium]|nr:SLC13 family permease [Rhodospirillales bacterium]